MLARQALQGDPRITLQKLPRLLCKPAMPVNNQHDAPRRKDRLKRDLIFLRLRHHYY